MSSRPTTGSTGVPSTSPGTPAAMSHREVLVAMSGLLLGMFVSILAGTVVSTSLPRIIADLGGTQAAYTWVVTATLLATTVSTPIWGKLADLVDRKLLIQLSLAVFVVGSALAGFSQDTGTLIGFRVLQGLGAGGLTALVQIIMADIVSPRDRGKYMGLIGAVMAVGTVGGPLLGGMITDLLNWRWNFYVALPVAVAAIVVLQRTLHVPSARRQRVRIDYAGTALLAGGVSLLLVWVSLAGSSFDWISPASGWMVGGAAAMLVALVLVEMRVPEPIIPMSLFTSRTFTLAVLASVSVGVAMFGTSVFLSQYMQLARGATATQSGLMTFPMVAGLMIASTVVGALISRRGSWKSFVVAGSVLLTAGMALMGTIRYDTPFVLVSLYMVLLGGGVGMVMQNLVLVVQNDVDPRRIGVASSGIAFFRSLGGTIGVSALGAVLGARVADRMAARAGDLQQAIAASGDAGAAAGAALATGNLPNISALPRPIAAVVESVYGSGVADLFLAASPLGLLTVLAVVFLPNKPLGRQTTTQRLAAEGAGDTGRVGGVDGFDRDSEAGVTQSSGDGDAAVPPPGGDGHPGAGPGAGAGRTGERLVRIVTVERPADPVEAGTR
ncbi:MAG TPA: MDR family MFS transporter [Nakamurella sp.]|nr:MDR family MFS transporter [Nakamurella sp.]